MSSSGWWYDFFRDEGSFIAGFLTLAGGAVAYLAGVHQARATRESASAQIEELRRQADERAQELADARRAALIETVRALATEGARIERFARDRLIIAERRYSGPVRDIVHDDIAVYRIETGSILQKAGVVEFAGTGIMVAATRLNTMVDVLVSALESGGAAAMLEGRALIGHLQNVISAAGELKSVLERWEARNPIPL